MCLFVHLLIAETIVIFTYHRRWSRYHITYCVALELRFFFFFFFFLGTSSLLCSFNGASVSSHVMCAVVRFESCVREKTVKTVVLLAVLK